MNNPLSFSSVKLNLISKGGDRLKPASGFIVETDNPYYLITKWHVVTGKDIHSRESHEPISEPHTLNTAIHICGGKVKTAFHFHGVCGRG